MDVAKKDGVLNKYWFTHGVILLIGEAFDHGLTEFMLCLSLHLAWLNIIFPLSPLKQFLENGSLRKICSPGGSSEDRKPFFSFSQLLKGKKKSSLKIGKKLYEFYTAPIAKFWSYTIAYLVMMAMYIYVAMVVTPERYLGNYAGCRSCNVHSNSSQL